MDNLTVESNTSNQAILPEWNSEEQGNIRILVVDDQNLVRQKLRISIEPEPDLEIVGIAEDGQAALEQIKTLNPDIALIDIEMPGMNGLTTTQMISQRFTDTRVLVLSGYDDEQYIKDALKVGAKGYLLKTTPAEELIHAIRYIHKGYLQLGPGLFEKLESQALTAENHSYHHNSTPTPQNFSSPNSTAPSKRLKAASSERDWSSVTKELIDSLPQMWTRGLLYFLIVFIAILLPWSMLSKVDETGSARGRLEPKGKTIQLDAPVAGTVTAIEVKEGQQVKAGQMLMELDSNIVRADLQEAQAKLNGLSDQLKNLQILKNQLQMNIRAQQQQNQAAASEQLGLINQIQEKITLHQTQIDSTKQLLAKDQTLVGRYRQLRQEGIVSGVQLDDVERRMIENNQTLEQALSDKKQQQTELNRQQNAYEKIIHQGKQAVIEADRQLKEVESQIINTQSEIAQTKDRIKSLQHQLRQSQLNAPIDGTVFQLSIGHPGAVVQPSQPIAQIAPKGVPLVLKAQMPTQESGFLQVGMPVKLKFDAYPFQDYGIIEGRLSWISPDSKTLSQEQGQESVAQQVETFELEITLDSNYIQTNNKRIALTPGQTATAEVIVRQRRLIDFVLDPFKKLQKGGLDL